LTTSRVKALDSHQKPKEAKGMKPKKWKAYIIENGEKTGEVFDFRAVYPHRKLRKWLMDRENTTYILKEVK